MEKEDFEKLQRARKEANNDAIESEYNYDDYRSMLEEYFNSEYGKHLHENNRALLLDLLSEVEKAITRSVPDDKFKIPYTAWKEVILEMFKELRFSEQDTDILQQNRLKSFKATFEKYMQLDGNVEKKIGDKLYSLYKNPNVSLGVHGTSGKPSMYSQENSYMVHGLGCEYHDLTKTVGFQRGRGYRFNHSERNFLEILTYDFSKWNREADDHQYTYFVAIPTEFSTCNNLLFEEGKESDISDDGPYAYLEKPIEEKRRLKSNYIVGMMMDGNCQTFLDNPGFDLDLLLKQNEAEKVVNSEEESLTKKIGDEVKPFQKNIRIKG